MVRYPFVGRNHYTAEAADLFVQRLKPLDGVVRRADNPSAPVGHELRRDLGVGLVRRPLPAAAGVNRKEVVVDVPLDRVLDIRPRLLPCVCKVDVHGDAPVLALDDSAVLVGRRLQPRVMLPERKGRRRGLRRRREDHHPVLARQVQRARAPGGRHRQFEAGLLVGAQLKRHFPKFPEAPVVVDRVRRLEQFDDDVERLLEHGPEPRRRDVEQLCVCRETAGAEAEDHATLRQMVQKRKPFRQVKRVVERRADDRGAELDDARQPGSLGQEHVRRRDVLPCRRVVLADEELVITELFCVLEDVQVTVKCKRRAFRRQVQRHHEKRELQRTRYPQWSCYLETKWETKWETKLFPGTARSSAGAKRSTSCATRN